MKTKRKWNQIQQITQLTATNDQKQISGVYNFAPLSLVSLYIYIYIYIQYIDIYSLISSPLGTFFSVVLPYS